ncbi:unnamed protein product, partial [Closterium sp. NIES-54]
SSHVLATTSGPGPESAPCSCHLLSHQTLLWHHRLGQPSLPCLRGMASRVLVSGLPRSLPPLPSGPAPTCVPCVEGRQRDAPHSSAFPPTEAPLQTLHMDVWGPARVRGQGHERYFLLVVEDYSRYTTVFPLRSRVDVTEVLIDWIRAARLQLRESFGSDFPVLRLHSDRGGDFSSARLGAFCRARGIRQTFTLPASPQQNGIAERRIGMVMDVARTSMIHAAAPHFLWPFAVQYAAHQLNLQPRVSVPETSPTLRWTGKVGDASVFRVWGSRAFVRDLSADKLSARAVPCVFLGFPPDAPGWQFYHPTSRRVLSSQDVTFDESVPYYRLFPYRTAPLPPPPLFLVPGPPPVDPLPPQGPAPSGVSQVDAVEPVEVAGDSGAGSGGTEPGGAGSGGAEPWGAESGGAEPGGAEPGGAEPGSAEPGGEEPGGTGSTRVASRSALSRREFLSLQELREWFARRWSRAAGAGVTTGAAGTGDAAAIAGVGPAGASGAVGAGATLGVGTGVCPAGGTGAAGPAGVGAARASGAPGAGAAEGVSVGGSPDAGLSAGAGVGAVGAGGAAGTSAAAGGTGAVPAGSGDPARPRPYFVPLLEQVLGLPPSSGPAPSLECPQPVQSLSVLPPVSPLPAPSPYTGPTGGLAEHREPASRPASPVRTACTSGRAPRQRPPAVPRTHQMALRPSTASQRVPLPSPPESSLPVLAVPKSGSLRAASPIVARLLSTVVTDPSFESAAASALVAELVDFAACCRLDYAAGLIAESASICPRFVGGECALSTDVLEDRQEEFQCFAAAFPHLVSMLIAPEGDPDAPDIPTPRSYAEAIEGPYSSQWQSAMDAQMASWKSTGTYVDEVPPPGANIELRWLTYLLTDLGEQPRSPPVLYVDNKAMLALCREHRLEHRTKHIALRYFLARELQQRGQLRLAYVASEANTADIFTKALAPGDHQRFCTLLGFATYPESHSLRAASPTVARLLSTVVTDPSFESAAASALVAELVDFAASCRLDYAAGLVAESASVCPPSVRGECALSTDVLEDRQEEFPCFAAALPHLVSLLIAPEGDPDAPDIPTPRSYAEAIEGPYSSQWQSAMDAEMASWKSTGTYVDEVPPPGANIVIGMWIFRVKRPPGSPPVFKASYVARGFSQRQGVDYFQTFSPTPKMTTLRVLLHVAAQRDYELHSLDFSTAFLQGSLHEEIWLRRPPGFTGSFPPGTQWSLRRPVYGLRQAPLLHSFTPVHPCSGSYHVFATTSGPPSRNHFYSRHNRTLRCIFLARELQQRGQLRLAYVASQANTADIFTKALPPGFPTLATTTTLRANPVLPDRASLKAKYKQRKLNFARPAGPTMPSPTETIPPVTRQSVDDDDDEDEEKDVSGKRRQLSVEELQLKCMEQWLHYFSWLYISQTKDGRPCMRCSVCMVFGDPHYKYGCYGEGGIDIQKQTMRKHHQSIKHEAAVREKEQQDGLKKGQKSIVEFDKGDEDGKRVARLMAIALFICKSDAPIVLFVALFISWLNMELLTCP